MSKEQRYRELISDVSQYYKAQEDLNKNDPVYLTWCKDCKEINLWTYWQGRGNLDAKIMLVGQDWGCPVEMSSPIQSIQSINLGETEEYHFDTTNPTDKNLVKLFQSIGIDISNGRRDDRLFFTNFVLGYRNKGLTGNFKAKWVRESIPFFRRLVDIIEPQIIICLGKTTFCGVLNAFEQPLKIRRYNDYISCAQNPVCMHLPSSKPVQVFAVSHCGAIGTLNRNRPKDRYGKSGLDLQKEDWVKIRTALESLPRIPPCKPSPFES